MRTHCSSRRDPEKAMWFTGIADLIPASFFDKKESGRCQGCVEESFVPFGQRFRQCSKVPDRPLTYFVQRKP